MALNKTMAAWGLVGLLLIPACDAIKLKLGKDSAAEEDDGDDDDDDDDDDDEDDDASKKKKKKKKRKSAEDDDERTSKTPAPEPTPLPTPAPEATPSPIPATPVVPLKNPTGDPQTDTWLDQMRALLPKELCKQGTFFRECFTITEAECMQVSREEFEPCVKNNLAKLPRIRDASTGQQGGEILGRCVGIGFQTRLDKIGRFTNTPKCNDPSQW